MYKLQVLNADPNHRLIRFSVVLDSPVNTELFIDTVITHEAVYYDLRQSMYIDQIRFDALFTLYTLTRKYLSEYRHVLTEVVKYPRSYAIDPENMEKVKRLRK